MLNEYHIYEKHHIAQKMLILPWQYQGMAIAYILSVFIAYLLQENFS